MTEPIELDGKAFGPSPILAAWREMILLAAAERLMDEMLRKRGRTRENLHR